MIVSASRRTDIPALYLDWLETRLQEGYAYVQNPFNEKQISRVALNEESVDLIVYWTKDPRKLALRPAVLERFAFLLQCTITPYKEDLEPGLAGQKPQIIQALQSIAAKYGKERVVWRYDPVLLSERYPLGYHIDAFSRLCGLLKDATGRVVISYIDIYKSIEKAMAAHGIAAPSTEDMQLLGQSLAKIAKEHGLAIQSCAEPEALGGIEQGACISQGMVEGVLRRPVGAIKDPSQRGLCRCLQSVDIGSYHSCTMQCAYCYANWSGRQVASTVARYDAAAPMLCGQLPLDAKITERKMKPI